MNEFDVRITFPSGLARSYLDFHYLHVFIMRHNFFSYGRCRGVGYFYSQSFLDLQYEKTLE